MKRLITTAAVLALSFAAAETASAQSIVIGGGNTFGQPFITPGAPGFSGFYSTKIGNNSRLTIGYNTTTWYGPIYAPPVISPVWYPPIYPVYAYPQPFYANPWTRQGPVYYPGIGWRRW